MAQHHVRTRATTQGWRGASALALGVPLAPGGVLRMPSGVYVSEAGTLLTGAAARAAGTDKPSRYLPDPAAHLTAGEVDVAGRTVSVINLYAAILQRSGQRRPEPHGERRRPVPCR